MKSPRVSSPVTYVLIISCIGWVLMSGMDLIRPDLEVLISAGANFQPLTFGGEYWRLITSLFLHYGFLHLLLNSLALLFLGRAIEPQTGSLTFLGLFLIFGLAGSLASSYWNLFTLSMGASGAIFGLFGFDMVLTLSNLKHHVSELIRVLLSGVVYVALILLIGQLLPFDNAAHAGGFVAGLILGTLYILPIKQPKTASLAAGVLLIVVGFLIIPSYQVIHYRQFTAMRELEENNQAAISGFSSDAIALEGYRKIQASYDSLSRIFSDSLGIIPSSLRQDRKTLETMMQNRALETSFKVKLLEKQSYRYLDSIEWALQKPVPKLNHPLSFATPDTTAAPAPRNIVRVWYDENWKETVNPLNAEYYRLGFKDSLSRWHGQVEDYFLNGGIQMKGQYTAGLRDGIFRYYTRDSTYSACGRYDKEIRKGRWEFFHENGKLAEIRNFADQNYLLEAWDKQGREQVTQGNGKVVEYHPNGEILSVIPYQNGLPQGRAFGNYPDGSRKFEEIFENGTLVQGRSYQGDNTNTYDQSIYYPFPAGGMKSFEEFVDRQSRRSGLTGGEVKLLFTCPPSGELYDIRVWKGHSPAHDTMAVRILENGPDWIPAREHGLEPITSEGMVTITFKQ